MDTETTLTNLKYPAGGLCLGCQRLADDNYTSQELIHRLSSALRVCKVALAVCSGLCLLLVFIFAGSIYVFLEVQAIRQEISKTEPLDDNSMTLPAALFRKTDASSKLQDKEVANQRHIRRSGNKRKEKETKLKGGKGKKNPCYKCCKKVRKLERSVRSLQKLTRQLTTQAPTLQPDIKENGHLSYIAAAHYSTYMTDEFINRRFGVLDPGNLDNAVKCQKILEWAGEACRNRTFTPHGSAVTLNVFEEADWMKNVSQERLFDKRPDGTFIARHTGIYLLYTHILFYDVKTSQAVAIVHESGGVSKNILRCMESVDYVDPDLDIDKNSRYKSCSVNGVLFMSAGDKVMVKNLYSHTRIDLTGDATYFGGLLFAARTDT